MPLPAVDPSGVAMGNRFRFTHKGVGGVTKIKLRQHHTVEWKFNQLTPNIWLNTSFHHSPFCSKNIQLWITITKYPLIFTETVDTTAQCGRTIAVYAIHNCWLLNLRQMWKRVFKESSTHATFGQTVSNILSNGNHHIFRTRSFYTNRRVAKGWDSHITWTTMLQVYENLSFDVSFYWNTGRIWMSSIRLLYLAHPTRRGYLL